MAGQLDERKLDTLLADAAPSPAGATYRQRAPHPRRTDRRRSLPPGAERRRRRPDSRQPATTVRKGRRADQAARGLIAAETDLAQWLSTAKPEAVTAWQSLDGHLATVSAIGAIAAQFGPRVGNFPLIVEYALADNFRIDDRAVFCADGPHIEIDSAAFQRSTAGHRGSPWFKVSLKLNTVAEAQERYRIFAEASWERVHGGPRESWIDGDGKAHEMPRPENPFKAKVPTT